VSSSGHLVILQEVWGLDVPALFDVLLHVATALVVLVFLRKEVAEILGSLSRFMRRWRAGGKVAVILNEEKGAMTAWLIVVGTIPTALIGFVLWRWIKPLFHSLTVVAIGLIITGIVLSLTYAVRKRDGKPLGTAGALAVGLAQAIALIPGISRSGMTISTGLMLGAERVRVARYSFLLAVPAILGAALAGVLDAGSGSLNVDALSLTIALVSAAVSAFLALRLLFAIISRARFYAFAPYCLAIGIALLIWVVF
jgi:undecaprenyl-diphosphatase